MLFKVIELEGALKSNRDLIVQTLLVRDMKMKVQRGHACI